MSFEFTNIDLDTDQRELIRRLNESLQAIENTFNDREIVRFLKQPQAPYNGMIFYADVADWNPGAGTGVYAYFNGYIKLG